MLLMVLINGLAIGSLYALTALGFNLIFGLLKMMNFAHGALFMIGALLCSVCITYLQMNLLFAMLSAVIITGVLGLLMYLFAYRPIGHNNTALLLSSLGMSIILENVARIIYGSQTTPFPYQFNNTQYAIYNIVFSQAQLIVLTIALLLMIGLYFIIRFTKIGLAIRAISFNQSYAKLMGIPVTGIIMLVFFSAAFLAALSGIMTAIYYNAVFVSMGLVAMLRSFAAVVVGGIGSISGALLGGIMVGLLESIIGAYLSPAFIDGIIFFTIIVILFIRPNGLVGKKIVEKV